MIIDPAERSFTDAVTFGYDVGLANLPTRGAVEAALRDLMREAEHCASCKGDRACLGGLSVEAVLEELAAHGWLREGAVRG